jgi:hypothetical protein
MKNQKSDMILEKGAAIRFSLNMKKETFAQ